MSAPPLLLLEDVVHRGDPRLGPRAETPHRLQHAHQHARWTILPARAAAPVRAVVPSFASVPPATTPATSTLREALATAEGRREFGMPPRDELKFKP